MGSCSCDLSTVGRSHSAWPMQPKGQQVQRLAAGAHASGAIWGSWSKNHHSANHLRSSETVQARPILSTADRAGAHCNVDTTRGMLYKHWNTRRRLPQRPSVAARTAIYTTRRRAAAPRALTLRSSPAHNATTGPVCRASAAEAVPSLVQAPMRQLHLRMLLKGPLQGVQRRHCASGRSSSASSDSSAGDDAEKSRRDVPASSAKHALAAAPAAVSRDASRSQARRMGARRWVVVC